MSKARRLRLFARDGGMCHLCKRKVLAGEDYELDHIIPWALAFNDEDDNLRVAHKTCHRTDKTGSDVARIAKAKRQSSTEGGQAARRAKRGFCLIQSRGFPVGGPKQKIPSRPWGKKGDK
jgi:5-methylcytosine-specific restriction protein A